MRGTPQAYNNLAVKDSDTLYFISEKDAADGLLYLGTKLISGDGDVLSASSIGQLKDVLIKEGLSDKSLLVYNEKTGEWTSTSFEDLIFVGATSESSGIAGYVPAPEKGQTNLFLRSDGTWAAVSSSGETIDNNIVTIDNEDPNANHLTLINDAITTPIKGDIAIVRDLIINDKWEYTAYVYNGSAWAAMDGNYSAESVYFDDDILVTTPVGTIQELVNGQATLSAKGKNVKQVLSALLAERKTPTATKPSASIELTNSTTSYEVGTKVTPTWETTFGVGSYTYGPATGVTDAGGSVTSTKDTTAVTVAAGSLNGATGSFAEYQVEDNTKYYAYLNYGWNEGTSTPIDNFGDTYTDVTNNLPIQAASNKTDTSNKYISGYRKWFRGGLTTDSSVALDSSIIRDNLTGSTSAVSSQEFELKAATYENCKRIVIAIPSAANKGITKVFLKSASNADITSEFVEQTDTVDVYGANDYTAKPYRVWIYEPASLDSTEVYTITLG